MSKTIAVCGSPGSGKTSVALKLAQEIYYTKQEAVVFLSSDIMIPSMGYIFPNGKSSELYSVGVALDKTDIYREDVLKQMVNLKTLRNFGLLGYTLGENEYSYPKPTQDKVDELFRSIREIAEYIIVDCTNEKDDLISRTASSRADVLIQLINPDIKSMTYYASQAIPVHDHKILVMNILDHDLYLPIDEVKAHFKEICAVLPYSRPLKQQAITGTLAERLNDGKFHTQLAQIARQVN